MTTQTPVQTEIPIPVALTQMINGYWVTQSLHVAARLGIADLLADGPKTVEALAQSSGAEPRSLYRLLRALASLGVFAETADGQFTLTPLAEPLRSDVPGSLRGVAIYSGDPEHYRAWGDLYYSVTSGDRAFDHVFGARVFDYMAGHPDVAQTFDRAMIGYTTEGARAVVANYDFSGLAHIVDVAGGQGTLLAEILKANPTARGTLFEMPHVIERAGAFLAAQGVGDRCTLTAGDFFQSVPEGGDAYLLKWIMHDWEDELAVAILRNCRRAMGPGARLLLAEAVIPPGNDPFFGKLMDLNMLVMTGGSERTEAEFRALLATAGFELTAVVPTGGIVDIVEARPV